MSDIPSNIPTQQQVEDSAVLSSLSKDPIPCWLDCDPGHDDALAIMLASYSDAIRLIGISTVAGNQSIEKTTTNALQALNMAGLIGTTAKEPTAALDLDLGDCLTYGGLKVPILKGRSRPLIRQARICDEIHGESGLEGSHLPTLSSQAVAFTNKINSQTKHFTTIMYETFKKSDHGITLIATGPLTNIALLILNYPDVVEYISEIVLMGGAIGIGNTGPVAEFNIQVDPESAHIVFESNIPIYMVPLEVTHTVVITQQILDRIYSMHTPFASTIVDLLLFFKNTYRDVFGFDAPPLHDPCAVAFVIDPNIFTRRLMRVDIETKSELGYGQTVCDIYNMSAKTKNVHVCLKIDVDKFWNLMFDALHKANKNSPLNSK